MPLRDIQFKPGVLTEASDREVGKIGYWKDAQWVRFFNGLPQKMAGYTKDNATSTVTGYARGATDWMSLRGELLVATGTDKKLYVWLGGTFNNITPYTTAAPVALVNNPYTTTAASSTVTVAHVAHARAVGDFVLLAGAVLFDNVTMNGLFVVTGVTSANAYTVTATTVATAGATGGGAACTYWYELAIGSASSTTGGGWGLGTWGTARVGGGWGMPSSTTNVTTLARTWALDNWGEDLLASPAGGSLYLWDSSVGIATHATLISGAPATMQSMFVSSEDRHAVALGCQPSGGGANDPMLIRWSTDEDYTVWTPTSTNTAGDKRLDQGSMIMCGVKTRGEHLIFTNSHLYSMQFTGPPDTYAFRPLGNNGGVMGPLAAKEYEGVVYWMGTSNFYLYNGNMMVLPCSVHSHVFKDINVVQAQKTTCGVNRLFNEVWWWYPSADSDEIDRYVVYNTKDSTWVYGTLARTVYVGDSDLFDSPYAIGTDGCLYFHEQGLTANGAALTAYIESGDVELDEAGNMMMHVSKYVPDFKTLAGSVSVTFTGKRYPRATETQTSGPHVISSSTQFANPRFRARQTSIRIESSGTTDEWRVGLLRLDQKPHGAR